MKPLEPGCFAWLREHRCYGELRGGFEVRVLAGPRRAIVGLPCTHCGRLDRFWDISGPAEKLGGRIGSCECLLMRIDGLPEEEPREEEVVA